MAFARPTLSELINRTLADTTSRLSADELLRRADAEVLARVLAGAAHGLYGYIDWLSRQILPDTSESEWLERHASLWLSEGRKPAAAASGLVSFTGISGSVVPAGTVLTTAAGVQVATTAEATLTAGAASVAAAAVDAGAAGNLVAGTPLSLVSPIAGVQSTATVASGGLTGGADVEDDEALRSRVIARIQQPPQGGCAYDYEAWALQVEGVTRAWVYPQELGLGTVTVRFVRDDDASLIPDAGEVATVQTHIDALRPVTAQVTVVAPVAVPLDMTITGLMPDTATVRAAIGAEITDLLRREAVPGGTVLLSHLREAISIAAGESDHELAIPAANVTHATGELAVLGTITWA
jgi:uncharacterized phage protein gp47/JayE